MFFIIKTLSNLSTKTKKAQLPVGTAPYTLYILSEWSLLYLYYFCLSNRLVLDLATKDNVCQRSGNEDRRQCTEDYAEQHCEREAASALTAEAEDTEQHDEC